MGWTRNDPDAPDCPRKCAECAALLDGFLPFCTDGWVYTSPIADAGSCFTDDEYEVTCAQCARFRSKPYSYYTLCWCAVDHGQVDAGTTWTKTNPCPTGFSPRIERKETA